MDHQGALARAKDIAERILAPAARQNDKEGRFSTEAVEALGRAGLLGLMLPAELGGLALGPRTFAAVTASLGHRLINLIQMRAAASLMSAR
jgi:alkylation response protein AidB-like acyl-CoA dehydrogenase